MSRDSVGDTTGSRMGALGMIKTILSSALSRRSVLSTLVGTFTQTLYDEAKDKGWTVISMKDDWNRIFSFEGTV